MNVKWKNKWIIYNTCKSCTFKIDNYVDVYVINISECIFYLFFNFLFIFIIITFGGQGESENNHIILSFKCVEHVWNSTHGSVMQRRPPTHPDNSQTKYDSKIKIIVLYLMDSNQIQEYVFKK